MLENNLENDLKITKFVDPLAFELIEAYSFGPLSYHNNWNDLMKVVEKIESIDISKEGYSWEFGDIIRYNNYGFNVEIDRKECWIYETFALDPVLTHS